MPKFLYAYHGGKQPESPEEGAKAMEAWSQWFDKMGDAVVDAGNPVGASWTVKKGTVEQTGGANPVSGYSIIQAPDMVTAVNYAKGCPMVTDGSGSIEVAEIIPM